MIFKHSVDGEHRDFSFTQLKSDFGKEHVKLYEQNTQVLIMSL